MTEAATNSTEPKAKTPVRHAPPPYVKPLIPKPLVYRRIFKHRGRDYVAELHEDSIVLHLYGGRRQVVYKFSQLWASGTGEML